MEISRSGTRNHSSDEFGRLGKNFNQMLERIQKLISQIYEEQKKLKNSELKALQAQIQPHFLYNSLDSVMWLLRMDKNRDAEKMLNELSTLFKISLSKGNEIITIEEELRHISSYLFITNMIYSKKFEYAIECDPVLYSYRTLKLLLQPLAEMPLRTQYPCLGRRSLYRCAFTRMRTALYCPCRTSAGESTRKPLKNCSSSWEQPPTRTTGIPGMGSTMSMSASISSLEAATV